MFNKLFSRLRGEGYDTPLIAGEGLVTVQYNHATKVVLLYTADPETTEETYAALESHLQKRGYFLQIVIAGRGSPLPRALIEQGLQ